MQKKKTLNWKNVNTKKSIVCLTIAFVSIVSLLTAASSAFNHSGDMKVTSSEGVIDASEKTLLRANNDEANATLSTNLDNDKIEYTKIGSDIYIVDYADAAKANQAVYETYVDNDSITANENTIMRIAGFSNPNVLAKEGYTKPAIPKGTSLRDYADANDKKIVAVIDTGVSSDIAVVSKNFTTDGKDDVNGHGTTVANAIVDTAGDKALILSLKAMNDSGAGYLSDVIEAIQYAKEQQVDIINLSISAEDLGGTDIFKEVIQDAINSGIKVVAAAGNYSLSAKQYVPSNIEGVESVGAFYYDKDGNKTIQSNSNYDATYYEEASSTSVAAAIHSGRLVNGETEFTSQTDLSGIKEINSGNSEGWMPILHKSSTETYSNDDNSKAETYMTVSVNLSSKVKSQIYATKGTTFITSPVQISDSDAVKEIYDELTGYYHYVYSDEDKAFSKKAEFEEKYSSNAFFITDIPCLFSTQAKTWGYSSEIGIRAEHNNGSEARAWGDATPYNGASKNKTIRFSIGAEKKVNGTVSWEIQSIGYYNASKTSDTLTMLEGSYPTTVYSSYTGSNVYSQNTAIQTYFGTWKSMCSGETKAEGNVTLTGKVDLRTIRSKAQAQAAGNTHNEYCDSQCMWYWSNSDWAEFSVTVDAGRTKSKVTFDGNGGTVDGAASQTYTETIGSTVTKTASHSSYTVTLNKNGHGTLSSTELYAPVTFKGWSFVSGNASVSGENVTYGSQDSKVKASWNDATVPTLPTLSATGYTFNGWYSGSTKYSTGTKITGNITLTASWTENSYKIVYNGNNSTGGSTSSQSPKYTDTVNIRNNGFTRTGYTFTGWNTSKDGTGTSYKEGQSVSKLSSTNGGTINLYAQWKANKYTVTFNSNADRYVRDVNGKSSVSIAPTSDVNQYASNSNLMGSQGFTYDQSADLSANKYKWAGHTFLGWSTNKNATSATYSNSQSVKNLSSEVDGKVTLYAIWKAEEHTLKIDPVKGSGTWNGSSNAVYGEDATYKDGKSNTKWGDKIILGDATPVDKSATITYNVNADDAAIDRTSDTVKWIFSRWKQNKGARGLFYNNDQNSNAENNGAGQRYYIIQDTNDTVTAVYYFQTVTLPTPTREGYTFLGWYENEALTKKANRGGNGNGGSLYRTESDVTLYARWQKNSFNYTDTEQGFMQDTTTNRTKPFEVYIRKADTYTKSELTTINGQGFKIGVYKNSVSDSNLKLILDTKVGITDAKGNKLDINKEANGYYKIFNGNDNNTEQLIEKNTTYVLHEISAAPGYYKAEDVKFTTNGANAKYITMYDKPFSPGGSQFKIKKVDEYGRKLAGAEFALYTESGTLVKEHLMTDEDGILSLDVNNYIVVGTRYKLVETTVPDGFNKAPDTYFVVPETDGAVLDDITIVDDSKDIDLNIKKVDSDDHPLEGAVFQLFTKDDEGELVPVYMDEETGKWTNKSEAKDGATVMTATTGADGIATFKELPLRANYTGTQDDISKSYFLKEIVAPEGYNLLPDVMEIILPDDGNKTFTYTVKDDSVTLTLEAGGKGIKPYIEIGGLLIALALLMTVRQKARN